MELKNIDFYGPEIDDPDLLKVLPQSLVKLLGVVNGWVQFGGGFHLRGACKTPAWHSLRAAWLGPDAFTYLYDDIPPEWVPFAEDCMGDQFFMTQKGIARLDAETGDLFEAAPNLKSFLEMVLADPIAALALDSLVEFQSDGRVLKPGELIQASPPFCSAASAKGVTLKAVPAAELYEAHSELADKMKREAST